MPDQDQLDRQAAIEILKEYDRKFGAIIDLIHSKPALSPAEKERARDLLRELKEDFARDCKELTQRDRQGDLNRIERTSLEPALRKASANIVSRVNTTPDGKWATDLAGARYDITWTLHNLENPKKAK